MRASPLWMLCLVIGCDGGGSDAGIDSAIADGGVDGGRDGGSDGGRDGGSDAGAPDAGPPMPAETAVVVMTEVMATRDALADVPSDMQLGGTYVDTDVVVTGIDAVIGEKGLGTLSLSTGAVRAWADLRQCNVLLDVLDRAVTSLAGASTPEEIALRDQLGRLRVSLVDHRDALGRLYVERRDLGVPGGLVVRDMFMEEQSAFGTEVPARLTFAVEGRTSGAPDGSLSVSCAGASLRVSVIDEVTNAEIASDTMGLDFASLTVPVAFDETSIVDVVIDGFGPRAMEYPECFVTFQSRRRFRTAPVPIDGGNTAFYDAMASFRSAQFDLAMQTSMLRSAAVIEPTVVDAVDAQAGVVSHHASDLVASGAIEIPVETLERLRREVVYVKAMTTGMLASPLVAPTDLALARADFMTMQAAVDAMLAAL